MAKMSARREYYEQMAAFSGTFQVNPMYKAVCKEPGCACPVVRVALGPAAALHGEPRACVECGLCCWAPEGF